MSQKPLNPDLALVSCEVCLKSIPAEETISSETVDYVAYFCGLECYDLWKRQQAANENAPADSSVVKSSDSL